MTGASRGGVGARAQGTGLGQGSSSAAVEARLTLLTVRSLGVTLTVQTHSRLWMAVVGVVIALAGSAASAAEVEETWMAFITLGSIDSCLTHAYS